MSKFSESINRAPRSLRVLVDVQQRLSREELERLFTFWIQVIEDDPYLGYTPTVEDLSRAVIKILLLFGTNCLTGGQEPCNRCGQTVGIQPLTEDQRDFVKRCTKRLWDSRYILERA
jgi:hypothetical protein